MRRGTRSATIGRDGYRQGKGSALSDIETIRLGDVAERVPGMTAATRDRLGCSADSSLPARFVSLDDFDDGLLRAVGSAYMREPPAPGSRAGRPGGRLLPGDLCFSRVGGRFAGLVQADFGKALCCSENIVAAHLNDDARPASAAIARWISLGAGGQMERISTVRGAAASWDAVSSILIPATLLRESRTSEAELAPAIAAYEGAVAALDEARAREAAARSELDSAVLRAVGR